MYSTKAVHPIFFIIAVLLASVFFSNVANASLYTKDAALQSGFPVKVNEGDMVWGDIDFGYGFSFIDSISVKITFGPDELYFPTDDIVIGFPSQYGYMGMGYTSGIHTWPLSQYLFGTNWQDPMNSLIDGSTNFYIEMAKGSVDINSIQFQVSGSAVPIPSAACLLFSGIAVIFVGRTKYKKCS